MKKSLIFAAVAVTCMAVLLVSLPASGLASEDVPLADGELWSKSSRPEKIAYIVGISNLMVVEYLFQEGANKKPTDDQTIIRRLFNAAEDVTLDGIIDQIDQWYEKHPDKMKEPVLVVIWQELVEK